MDRLGRTMGVCAGAYGLLGAGCLGAAFITAVALEFQVALILSGSLLLVTAFGVARRVRWTRWLAVTTHAFLIAPLVLLLNGLTPWPHGEHEAVWASLCFVIVAGLYFALLRFWKSQDVQTWFSLGPSVPPTSSRSNP